MTCLVEEEEKHNLTVGINKKLEMFLDCFCVVTADCRLAYYLVCIIIKEQYPESR